MANKGTGGGSTPLAEWVVQIGAEGAEALDTALARASDNLTTVEAGAKAAANTLTTSLGGAADHVSDSFKNITGGSFNISATASRTINAPPGARTAPPTGALQPAGAMGGAPNFAAIQESLDHLNRSMGNANLALQVFANNWRDKQKAIADTALQTGIKVQAVQAAMALGYTYLTSKLMGFINAGLSGTGYAQMFAFQMEWINREITAIFVPAIDKLLSLLDSLRAALGNLTGNQQAMIRNLTAGTLAFLGMAVVVPRVINAIEAMGIVIRGAFLANPILGLVSAMGAILVSTQEGRTALGELAKSLEPFAASLATIAEAVAPVFASMAEPIAIIADVLATVLRLLAPIVEFAGPALILGGAFYFIGTAVGTVSGQLITMGAAAASSFATATAGALTTTGAINLLTGALQRLKVAFLSNPLGWLALGAGILLSFLAKKPEVAETNRSTAPTRAGGFEELERTFYRLEEAGNRSDIPRRQLQTLESILAAIRGAAAEAHTVAAGQPLVA